MGQCALTIRQVTVSGCYSVSGSGKATVSVNIGWANPPANDYIVVTSGTASRTLTPGPVTVNYGNNGTTPPSGIQTIVSPQTIAFEIDADGSTGAVSAVFASNPSCSATASFTAPAACVPAACLSGGLGGIVFNDYNANGIHDTGETNGVAGVVINVYDCDNNQYQATSDATGRWLLTETGIAYPVRVEFSNIPAAYLGTSTPNGTGSRTTVQFVTGSSCEVSLGVNDPLDYCQSAPMIITPCYVMGDPLQGGSSATADAIVGFPYYSTGMSGPKTFTIQGQYVGTTWAQVYNKATKQLFSAAILKRHAGLGPGGLDAIYVTDLSDPGNPGTPAYISLSSFGINVGTVDDNISRGLVPDRTSPSVDQQAFEAIGKVGIGGMSLSSDSKTLYLMNIRENALYALDLTAYNLSGDPGDISLKGGPYAVPDLGCINGAQRSWAVKYNKGKVYVGTVCDAADGTRSDLVAGVFAFDPVTETFNSTPVFNFPLTYPKGYPDVSATDITGWFPWTDNFSELISATYTTPNSAFLDHPQPVFSDIEFDIDGSLILAFNDRTGLQSGFRNYGLDGNNNNDYTGIIGGDILRAYFKNGTYVLENNAKAGPATGYGAGNNQGPGFGEFYNDDSGVDFGNSLNHSENSLGALALRPGSGEVISAAMDPLGINTPYPFINWAAGIRRMNNSTGLVNDAYVVYATPDTFNDPGAVADGTFGKAAGLGDLELACDQVQYMEIGNRVWIDSNHDGIQDACEPALPGVKVGLYKNGSLIAVTETNTDGEYYFSAKSKLVTGIWSGTDADTTLLPNTAYQLVFGVQGQFTGNALTLGAIRYQLTTADSTTGTGNDLNDSDAAVGGVNSLVAPVISLTTGNSGWVNHTYDAGFVCEQCGLRLTKLVSTSKAQVGDVITYTLVLTNTGPVTASNVVVRDSISSSLAAYQPATASVTSGTYTPGIPVSTWALASLPANGTAALVISASVLSEGVIYNGANVPGDTTTVCTSVAFKVCQGSNYAIRLTAPAGYSQYQWIRQVAGQPEQIVYDGPLNSYTATQAGSYIVRVNAGGCPQDACCPQLIEEDSIPSFSLVARASTCSGSQPQANGQIELSTSVGTGQYTYQYSAGAIFDQNTASLATQIPADGVLIRNLSATQTYTIRMTNATGCYRDVAVTITVSCDCPLPACVPVTVTRIK
ncbi:SdrD B-like domain-containing protein [Arsenicibacter rosenii]|uniref:SdrD B-like domain-containing protein n=1 Tax=Arsenicibacter rosenii TaxID=1750698 RepID=UPI0015A6685D|nr:SdrD B-like domain-containing protein [Arsenicibacter rosenii]